MEGKMLEMTKDPPIWQLKNDPNLERITKYEQRNCKLEFDQRPKHEENLYQKW